MRPVAKTIDSFDGERFFCAMGGRKNSTIRRGTCSGDSGGGLIAKVLDEHGEQKFTLIGIVSFGEGPFANCGSFGSYTKVSKFLNFIRDPIHNY